MYSVFGLWFIPRMDAAVGVDIWAQQDQPVLGHHEFSGSPQVDEEYLPWDAAAAPAAAGAGLVFSASDRSGSFADDRAAGHGGGKFLSYFLCLLIRKRRT